VLDYTINAVFFQVTSPEKRGDFSAETQRRRDS